MIDLKGIRHIIFDLGGVILNIDYKLSAEAFKKLGANDFDELYSQAKQSELFDRLETGRISLNDFRNEVRRIFEATWSDTEIDSAWNAMLLDLPPTRIELLQELKKRYKIYLLSNTNQIHYDQYGRMLRERFGLNDLSEVFDKAYYSHEVGMRKPDAEVFEFVLNANAAEANETLFIDDSIQHIEGAKRIGLETYHLREEDILGLF